MDTALDRSGVSVSSWQLGSNLGVIITEIGLLWHPVHLFITLGFIGLTFAQAEVLADPRRQTVVLALGGCTVLYWIAMARIAALEPMFNTLMPAPFIAVCFAVGLRELFQGRLAALCVPVIVLVVVNVYLNRDSWQSRLYNIYNNEGYEVATLVRQITKPGACIFEDGHEIGPGRLMYYAPGRGIIKLHNYPAPPGIHPADSMKDVVKICPPQQSYLIAVSTRVPDVISEEKFLQRGMRLEKLRTYAVWTIFKVESVASKE